MTSIDQSIMELLRASAYIPDGMSWGDYFMKNEEKSVVSTVDYADSSDEGEWNVVSTWKPPVKEVPSTRPPKWCKHGNACIWQNCPFRHERCAHYDNWVSRGKRGHNCRCYATDPDSCKTPEEGGCKYDHRDTRDLEVYYETLPCATEKQLWDSFYDRGLEAHCSTALDVSEMTRTNRALLVRSLNAYNVDYEDNGNWFHINMDIE
jgi:hypothetical protein